MNNTDLPANWMSGGGEASRPIEEGGYYVHYYVRRLPGSNQYVEDYLEMVVDVSDYSQDAGPRKHHIKLSHRRADGMSSWEVDRLDSDTVRVADRNNPTAQADAESDIHDRALEMMRDYTEFTA